MTLEFQLDFAFREEVNPEELVFVTWTMDLT